jgi:hypothetical protein
LPGSYPTTKKCLPAKDMTHFPEPFENQPPKPIPCECLEEVVRSTGLPFMDFLPVTGPL